MKKLIRIAKLNIILFRTRDLGILQKMSFVVNELVGVLYLLLGRRRMNYFGEELKFDNPSTVFTILQYPYEINNKIRNHIRHPIRRVLDIGGNVGQFSLSLANLIDEIELVDVFEPNPEIYKMLEYNAKNEEKIHCYNSGVGKKGKAELHYVQDKSAKGSLIEEVVVDDGADVTKSTVDLISNVPMKTGVRKYDLVKIDVEGFELEVVKELKDIKLRYLFIELSAGNRRMYRSSEIHNVIFDNWGSYNIKMQSQFDRTSEAYDVLFEFNSN